MSQQTTQPFELDVRVIPPRDKHPTIFRTFDALQSGESFILVNDHDPRPLRYQLAAERPNAFEWTYLAQGPTEWRVQIARRTSTPTIDCSQTVNQIVTQYPETLPVFTAWGIDTCCGGGHPVEAVVQRHQLDGEALCNALVTAIGTR